MLHQWPFAVRAYAGGALAAACAIVVASAMSLSAVWVGLLTTATLYLGYQACLSHVRAERPKARQMLYEIAQTIASGLTVADTMGLVLGVESGQIPVAISAGIAVFPQDGRTYESLLAVADREMYADKHARKTETLAS